MWPQTCSSTRSIDETLTWLIARYGFPTLRLQQPYVRALASDLGAVAFSLGNTVHVQRELACTRGLWAGRRRRGRRLLVERIISAQRA